MALISPNKLTLLPFPQRWDGNDTIKLRAVVLPRGNPRQPLMTGIPATPDGPPFADANVQLKAVLIPGLDQLPDPTSTKKEEVDLFTPLPAELLKIKRLLFERLQEQFDIDPTLEPTESPRHGKAHFKKLLVPSYRSAFAFSSPRTKYAVTDDSYACALRKPCRLMKPPGPPPTRKTVWGRIIAQALRQPLLAEELGLLYKVDVKLPNNTFFKDGGWLYLSLDTDSDYAEQVDKKPELLSVYAARIPPLGAERNLFAAVLFPVSLTAPSGNFDELFREAADYDDGFAKIAHCAQQTTSDPVGIEDETSLPIFTDTGVQLGWDDEQIIIWKNRQIEDSVVETRESPMGVMGYRVDVCEQGTANWFTMMLAEADLVVGKTGETEIGHFEGELTVEVNPVQLDNEEDGDYWMPTYFTQWQGRSLVTADETGMLLSGTNAADLKRSYQPVNDDKVPLRYGKTYEFRVRLADISGGGPGSEAQPVNPAPAPIAECHFRRHVRPKAVIVEGAPATIDPNNPPAALKIHRPLLNYPAAVFAGIPNATDELSKDLQSIYEQVSNGGEGREPGLPDPDVGKVGICVQVVGLEMDTANTYPGPPPLRKVYETTRAFPADPALSLVLDLEYQDVSDIETLNGTPNGPILIPTARDVVITFTPIGKEDPNLDYFGSEEARFGQTTDVRLRSRSSDECSFFVPDTPGNRIRGIMLQPDEATTKTLLVKLMAEGKGEEAETDLLHRLASELDLGTKDMGLTGRPGQRVVFGCSSAIAHIIGPDGSTITFSSKADLALRWIMVTTVSIDRDWTWDGADDPCLKIERDGAGVVGYVRIPRIVNTAVMEGPEAAGQSVNRSSTDVIFLDAVDPKDPEEMSVSYTVTPQFLNTPNQDTPLVLIVDLPIAVKPAQTPKLMSAGIALSPYMRSDDYSSTEPRQRMLWLEFDGEPDNTNDTYFARVLSYAPDPMLTNGEEVSPPPEPPLPIAPEYIRVIRPGQSDDRAGLNDMEMLIPTDSSRHFMVRLPDGLNSGSRELFGFFVYELRVGHYKGWSTAKARYGPALRVTGVQHPAPVLPCQVVRTRDGIIASASYATPVFEGRNMLPPWPQPPVTQIWIVLYAQVMQADGKDYRNILLGHRKAWIIEKKMDIRNEADLSGNVTWSQNEIETALEAYGLPLDNPLSVLAVELLPDEEPPVDPLGADLGQVRILRTSPLMKVPPVCVYPPCLVKVTVPDLIKMKKDDAIGIIEAIGLEKGNIETEETAQYEPDTVVGQNPLPDAEVDMGSPIDLVVSVWPSISVSPSSLDFGIEDTKKSFTIANGSGGTMGWRITSKQPNWIINVFPNSGSLQSGTSVDVLVEVYRRGMDAGEYNHSMSIRYNDEEGNIITVPFMIAMKVQS